MPDLVVAFRPFANDEAASFLEATRLHFISELVATGVTAEDASGQADAAYERLCPGGAPTPGQLVGSVTASGDPIGALWLGPAGTDSRRWWVFFVEVDVNWRGKGYGRQAMRLAEELARDHGADEIGLNVFARNSVAVALYSSLGYMEVSKQMTKPL